MQLQSGGDSLTLGNTTHYDIAGNLCAVYIDFLFTQSCSLTVGNGNTVYAGIYLGILIDLHGATVGSQGDQGLSGSGIVACISTAVEADAVCRYRIVQADGHTVRNIFIVAADHTSAQNVYIAAAAEDCIGIGSSQVVAVQMQTQGGISGAVVNVAIAGLFIDQVICQVVVTVQVLGRAGIGQSRPDYIILTDRAISLALCIRIDLRSVIDLVAQGSVHNSDNIVGICSMEILRPIRCGCVRLCEYTLVQNGDLCALCHFAQGHLAGFFHIQKINLGCAANGNLVRAIHIQLAGNRTAVHGDFTQV